VENRPKYLPSILAKSEQPSIIAALLPGKELAVDQGKLPGALLARIMHEKFLTEERVSAKMLLSTAK